MLPDRVSNPGPLTYESGALPIALRGPANNSRARAYCACSRCGTFFLSSIFSLFFLPLWKTARYRLKYCLKGPLNPKHSFVSGMRTPVYSCNYVYSKVSDKNACPCIDSDLITHSTILDSILRRFIEKLSRWSSRADDVVE